MKKKALSLLFDATYHGKYDFDDFLYGDVTADYDTLSLKRRNVCRPSKKLKAYHAFLNTFVCERLTTNSRVVYSYRRGINPNEAVLAHANSRAFFQTDIENFFGSIDRDLVQSTFRQQNSDVPISDFSAHIDRILDLTVIGGVLPVGFSTSPPLSNACLTDFDNDFENVCTTSGFVYTRYADDIIVSSQNREELYGVDSIISNLLDKHFNTRFRLNETKTKLTSTGRKIRLLGMVILPSGRVTIDMSLKKRIEVLLHFYVHDRGRFLDYVGDDMDTGIEQLSGYINYINSADRQYLEKLRKKFGSTVIDIFLHRSTI